jgi:hypothetical protein
MIGDVSVMKDRLFGDEGTIFATDLGEDLPLVEEALAETQQVATEADQLRGIETCSVSQQGTFYGVDLIFKRFDRRKLLIYHVIQDEVHQEGWSLPNTLDVCLHDALKAIQEPAIFGIPLADGDQKVVADKQIDLAD